MTVMANHAVMSVTTTHSAIRTLAAHTGMIIMMLHSDL